MDICVVQVSDLFLGSVKGVHRERGMRYVISGIMDGAHFQSWQEEMMKRTVCGKGRHRWRSPLGRGATVKGDQRAF